MNYSTNGIILFNGNILTMNFFFPLVSWAQVKNGIFLRIGNGEKWKNFKTNRTECINLNGKTVLPGFIDSHQHFVSYAKSLISLDCKPGNNIRSISDFLDLIRSYSLSKPAGQWILGKGYNEFHFSVKRHPRRRDLDQASANHPVRLTHQSGHVHALNTLALKEVGIDKETPDPPGGIIERDLNTGEPTGLLYEMGEYLSQRIPRLDVHEMQHGIRIANKNLISMGITSIQEASSKNDAETWERLSSWKKSGLLLPRVHMMLGWEAFQRDGHHFPLRHPELSCSTIKIIIDETTGRLKPCRQELQDIVSAVHKAGLQVALHALEESAIEAACDAVDLSLKKKPRTDHRHRIEHCAVCPPVLLKRIAALGILVVTQPPFLFFNGDRYLQTVPLNQQPWLYPLRSLLDKKILTAGSSDCPVVDPNPLLGIRAALNRKTESGSVLGKKEVISLAQAVNMYTHAGSLATFEEHSKGSIAPGKVADLVVLSEDLNRLPPENLQRVRVEKTMINGRIVWDSRSQAIHPASMAFSRSSSERPRTSQNR